MASRPPLPPFTQETAIQKVRLAEDGWNTRDPEKVSLAYTVDSKWRNRAEFPTGRVEIVAFLTRKWTRELDSSRNCGPSGRIESPYDSHMNTTTIRATGIEPTETRIGSSMNWG